eukprot:1536931-Amphidinium_carterae.1
MENSVKSFNRWLSGRILKQPNRDFEKPFIERHQGKVASSLRLEARVSWTYSELLFQMRFIPCMFLDKVLALACLCCP